MNIQNYLNRIQVTQAEQPTLSYLQTLQKQHLLTVPFENCHIHNHIPIILNLQRLFDKIVIQKHGGFCYELNGLFFYLLRASGFTARLVSAQVYSASTGGYGQEFDHMAILVTIDKHNYLVDVGFGEFAFYPLKIAIDCVLSDQRGNFLIKADREHFVVYKETAKGFQPEYRFNSTARRLSDFDTMCRYHQTDSASHFTQKRLLSLATENGRITISGNQLIIREGKQITESPLPDEIDGVITQYFSPFPTAALK